MSDQTYEGEYVIRSEGIYFVAQTSLVPPQPSHVSICSMGGGDLLKNGHIVLNATGEITLQSGPSFIEIDSTQATCNIAIVNGMPGSIVLSQGVIVGSPKIEMTEVPPALNLTLGPPGAGAAIALSPTGVKLSYGPPGVGASVELGPTGVTLKFAAWSLALTATGIDLAVGPNKLSLQPQGVALDGLKLDLAAITNLTLQGLQIDETAALKLKAQGVMTMLG